ncbi:response regulator [Neomegalonema perideroedes]|uniref:response regulator n=1 Tax=Neomegalonema perideroedes TaxID=217219 RepID=UPI000371E8FC|nr:response regulator [Neomegalonema perideroedes]
MKTAYHILWIDDDPKSTDTDQEDVKEFLDEVGIRADITFVEAPADGSIKERLEHHLKDPDLDLLMVDYHMAGLQGDQLVRLIRETDHIYLPVIFYSSSTVSDLLNAVRTAELDGVYIANRAALIQKVRSVVGSLLVREQTVKQVRGLLMEGVSEIDTQFREIFLKVWPKLNPDQQAEVAKYLKGIVDERVKSATKRAEDFPLDSNGLGAHLTEKFLTTAYDTYTRWRLTRKILDLSGHAEECIGELKKFAEGNSDGVPLNSLRNDYAHKSRKLLSETHDLDRCISIRRSLRAQAANIDAILGSE